MEYVRYVVGDVRHEAEDIRNFIPDVRNDVPETQNPSKTLRNEEISQNPLKTACRADRMEHVADEPRELFSLSSSDEERAGVRSLNPLEV